MVPFGEAELLIVSTIPEAFKVRFASEHGGPMAVSFCMFRPDGYPEELGLIQGKLDERERGTGRRAGEMTCHLLAPTGPTDDARMKRIFEARHDGILVDVPLTLASGYRLL